MDTMDLATALDYVRMYHARVVKPFEVLAEVLDFVASVDDQVSVGRAALVELRQEYEALEQTIAEAGPRAEAASAMALASEAKAADRLRTVAVRVEEAQRAWQHTEQGWQVRTVTLEADWSRRDADLAAQHEERRRVSEATIATLQARIAELVKEFDRLRSQFGS